MIKKYKIAIDVLKDELKICITKLNSLSSSASNYKKRFENYKLAIQKVKNRKKSLENILKYLGAE